MLVPDLVRQRAREIDFPAMYTQAMAFLEQCSRVDEVKDFSDKIAAAATYYKQKNDRRAFVYMRRLHINSAKSLGILCKTMPAGLLSESELRRDLVAAKLGLFAASKSFEDGGAAMEEIENNFHATDEGRLATIPIKERRDAVQISEMDPHKFLEAIESDKPPTVSALAARARRSKKITLEYTPEEEKVHERIRMCEEFKRDVGSLYVLSQEFNPKKLSAILLRKFNVRKIHRSFYDDSADDTEEIMSITPSFHLGSIERVSKWLLEIHRLLDIDADSQ